MSLSIEEVIDETLQSVKSDDLDPEEWWRAVRDVAQAHLEAILLGDE